MTTSTPRLAVAAAALLLLSTLAACGGGASGDDAEAAAPPPDPAFLAAEEEWRAERRERLLAEDGWSSLVGLHWLELKSHFVGSGPTSGIRIALGPPSLGLVQQEGDRIWFTPEQGVAASIDGEPVTRRTALHDDRDGAPTELHFDEGRGRLSVISRGPRRALRVKHADAPSRTGFGRIDYWPADEGWRVEARFVPAAPGHSIGIANIVGGIDALPSPGAVEFSRDGRDYRLEALEGADGGLFLILADRTSGQGSYGAGRYLETSAPDSDGRVMLNFNRAYNPPCAFTDFATCPLPPDGNRLDLAVTAGEKAYVKPGA